MSADQLRDSSKDALELLITRWRMADSAAEHPHVGFAFRRCADELEVTLSAARAQIRKEALEPLAKLISTLGCSCGYAAQRTSATACITCKLRALADLEKPAGGG